MAEKTVMTKEQYTEFKEIRKMYWDKFTVECPHCKAKIIKTSSNKEGKCLFRNCEGYAYKDGERIDPDIAEQYLGKVRYKELIGDVIVCINVVEGNKLVCITQGYPKILLLSLEEYTKFLK